MFFSSVHNIISSYLILTLFIIVVHLLCLACVLFAFKCTLCVTQKTSACEQPFESRLVSEKYIHPGPLSAWF